ncbi:MAG: sigma factor-like helix-turn-helix DNA-binding protein [Patescibacteria group bacterium]|jgi:hypothetical protein
MNSLQRRHAIHSMRTYTQRSSETYPAEAHRPKTRGECRGASRPCPWVSCPYHLAIEVTEAGSVRLDWRFLVGELRETCALDVADRGGLSLEAIGALLGLTRERVRQLEMSGLAKLAEALRGKLCLKRGNGN